MGSGRLQADASIGPYSDEMTVFGAGGCSHLPAQCKKGAVEAQCHLVKQSKSLYTTNAKSGTEGFFSLAFEGGAPDGTWGTPRSPSMTAPLKGELFTVYMALLFPLPSLLRGFPFPGGGFAGGALLFLKFLFAFAVVVGKHGAAQDQHKDGRSSHDQQYQLEDLYIKLLLQGLRGIRNDRFRCRSRRTGAVCGVLGSGQSLAGGIAVTQGSQGFGQGFAAPWLPGGRWCSHLIFSLFTALASHSASRSAAPCRAGAYSLFTVQPLVVHMPFMYKSSWHAGILQHGLVDDVAEVVGRGIHRAEVEYDELLGAGVIHHIGA